MCKEGEIGDLLNLCAESHDDDGVGDERERETESDGEEKKGKAGCLS